MTWAGGAGHILDAINRLRYNKSLLNTRKFNKLRTKYRNEVLKVEYHRKRAIAEVEISKEEKEVIKNRIRKQARIGVIKSLTATAVLIVCFILFFYLAVNWNT